MDKNKKNVVCKVCDYKWSTKLERPKQCPFCKSMKWDIKKKVYAK